MPRLRRSVRLLVSLGCPAAGDVGLAAAAHRDPGLRAGLERRARANRAGARGRACLAARLAPPVDRRDASCAALVEPAGLARLPGAARRQRAGLRRRGPSGRRRRHRLRRPSAADCPPRRTALRPGCRGDANGPNVHAGTEDRCDAESHTRSSCPDAPGSARSRGRARRAAPPGRAAPRGAVRPPAARRRRLRHDRRGAARCRRDAR